MASEEREQDDTSAAEMRMIKWVCAVKVTDRFSGSKLKETL